jgi:hypothetical protein
MRTLMGATLMVVDARQRFERRPSGAALVCNAMGMWLAA